MESLGSILLSSAPVCKPPGGSTRACSFLLLLQAGPQRPLFPHPQGKSREQHRRKSHVPNPTRISHLIWLPAWVPAATRLGAASWSLRGLLSCGVPPWWGGVDFWCKHGPSGKGPGAMFRTALELKAQKALKCKYFEGNIR